MRFPEVARVVTNLGRPQEATETMALNQADVYVTFKPSGEWRDASLDALIARMDSALAEIPGLDYEFSAPMRMRLDEVDLRRADGARRQDLWRQPAAAPGKGERDGAGDRAASGAPRTCRSA